MNRDRAVELATDLLDGTICECGHHESEHYFTAASATRTHKPCDKTCECREFVPVRFRVERLS